MARTLGSPRGSGGWRAPDPVAWMAFLVSMFLVLGFRARTLRGSTHLTILLLIALTLGVVFMQPMSAK